jgi:hypothetical protein
MFNKRKVLEFEFRLPLPCFSIVPSNGGNSIPINIDSLLHCNVVVALYNSTIKAQDNIFKHTFHICTAVLGFKSKEYAPVSKIFLQVSLDAIIFFCCVSN